MGTRPEQKYGPPKLLRPGYCAHQISRSPAFIYGLLQRGELRCVRVRGSKGKRGGLRIPLQNWEAWLAANVEAVDPAEIENDE